MNRRIKSVVCLAVVLACGHASAADEIRWAPDLLSARKASAQFKVPLLIHFYGDNCLPCKTVEERVFPRPELIETLNKYFICVKVNGSRMPNIAAEYNVHRWPTDVFLAPDGTSLYMEVSKQDVNAYMATLHNVAVRNRDRNTLLAAKAPPAQTSSAPTSTSFASDRSQSQAPPAQTASTEPNAGRVNYSQLPSYGRPYGQQQTAPAASGSPGTLANNNQPQTNSNNFYAGRHQDTLATHNADQQFTRPGVQVGPTTLNQQVQATPANVPGQSNNITGVMVPPQTNLLGQTQRQTPASPTAGQINTSFVGYDNLPTAGPLSATEQGVAAPGQSTSTSQRWQAASASSGAVIGNPYADSPAAAVPNRFVGYQRPVGEPAPNTAAPIRPTEQQSVAPKPAAAVTSSALPGNQAPALEGYCVIEAKRGSWTRGKPEFAVKHRGQVYWLSSLEAQQSFMSSPDAAAPLLSGYDPYVFLTEGRMVPGSIVHTLHERFSDQLLMFASAEAKNAYYPNDDKATFLRNTQTLQEIVEQANKK